MSAVINNPVIFEAHKYGFCLEKKLFHRQTLRDYGPNIISESKQSHWCVYLKKQINTYNDKHSGWPSMMTKWV